jgi:hypothetical protein
VIARRSRPPPSRAPLAPLVSLASLLALALSLAGAPGAARAAAPAEVFAISIGWNGGNAQLGPLRFADDDAVRMALFFVGMAGAPAPGRVWLLAELDDSTRDTIARAGLGVRPDGAPTREAVTRAFAEARQALARPARGPRVLYVFYAGHGLGGRVLLKPTDGHEAALTGAELRAALAGIAEVDPRLRVFVFLDACRSESLFGERGGEPADFGQAIAELERRARALPIGVLTAARSGRPAGEVQRLHAGYFSHVLTSGLTGAADANDDDVVSFGELAAFVAFHTEKLTGQMPWFDPPAGDLDAEAIDHRGRRARLVLPREAAGRFLVGTEPGLPVFVEAFKGAGRPLRLALPPGRYRVVRDGGGPGPGLEAAVALAADRTVDLGGASWRELDAARGGGDRAQAAPAEDRLRFSAPFSPEVVSTLAAGYHAGRSPTARAGGTLAELEAGLGLAPVGPSALEPRLGLRLRRPVGPVLLAALARAAQSRHTADDQRYLLRRYALGLELGHAWPLPGRDRALEAFVAGGWGAILRLADGGTSGDLASPWAELGGRVTTGLTARWSLSLAGRLTAVAYRLDRRWQTPVTGALDLGLGFSLP